MTRIERIQPSLHKKDRVLVYLTGGDLLRITPEELLRFDLRPGMDLAEDVLEELNRDYVTGARARGVREGVILRGSVLRCAMLTILTLLALSVGSLLGGTAIIESIFQWDGVGKLAVDAITMRDYPMIQAYVVWMAVIYVAVNLVTDLLYHALDPRIRLGVSRE